MVSKQSMQETQQRVTKIVTFATNTVMINAQKGHFTKFEGQALSGACLLRGMD